MAPNKTIKKINSNKPIRFMSHFIIMTYEKTAAMVKSQNIRCVN